MILVSILLHVSFGGNLGKFSQQDFFLHCGIGYGPNQWCHDNLPDAEWMTTDPQAASSNEQADWENDGQEDWWSSFDTSGWKTLPDRKLMTGWYRSGGSGDNGIHFIEEIHTAEPGQGFQESQCKDKDWTNDLDMNNFWALCDDGLALHGLQRSEGSQVSNIEKGRCCPGVTTNCYMQSVHDTLDYAGDSICAAGHAMTGFYRGTCNNLHCIEYFKCCRLIKDDPDLVHVIGYWVKDTYQRKASDRKVTVKKTMTLSETSENSSENTEDWFHDVSETNSVSVAVEGSAEWVGAKGSTSSEYAYTNTQNYGSAFSATVASLASKTLKQEIEVTEEFDIWARVDGEPIYANVWTWKVKAIKPDFHGGFLEASHYYLDFSVEKWGCGYDIPPNCLPGYCVEDDVHCLTCTQNQYIIDPSVVNPCEQECCESITLYGFPGGHQAEKDGTFVKLEGQIQDHLPVYQNEHGNFLYYWGAYDDWLIGPDKMSPSAGVTSQENKKTCPETYSKWKYYSGNLGGWSEITATVIDNNPCILSFGCCHAYEFSGISQYSQANREGLYVKVHDLTQHGLPVYQSENGYYLYYWEPFQDWRIGTDYTSPSAWIQSVMDKKSCPGAYSSWKAWHNNVWTDVSSDISVTCTGNCDFFAVPEDECPDLTSSLKSTDCVSGMQPGSYCEADDPLPNGNTNFNINNCGPYDIFQYKCNSQSAVGSSPVDLDDSAPNAQSAVGSSPVNLDESGSAIDASSEPSMLDSATSNVAAIENFSQKFTKIFAFFGVGAVIYGMTRCVVRKTGYETIDEPEV